MRVARHLGSFLKGQTDPILYHKWQKSRFNLQGIVTAFEIQTYPTMCFL